MHTINENLDTFICEALSLKTETLQLHSGTTNDKRDFTVRSLGQ